MFPESGRVYHPAPDKVGGVGLIKSSLARIYGDEGQYFQTQVNALHQLIYTNA